MSAIERSVRTPEEIKQERNERQAAWQLCTDRLKRLAEEETEAVSLLEKKYSKQIRVISGRTTFEGSRTDADTCQTEKLAGGICLVEDKGRGMEAKPDGGISGETGGDGSSDICVGTG